MVLQFEVTVDVLKIMHPSYDFVFLFDHSTGHAKQRPDGLNQHRMNHAVFGGKTTPMQSSVIMKEGGCLGPFPQILRPGDTQSLPCLFFIRQKEVSHIGIRLGSTSAIQLKIPDLKLRHREDGIEAAFAGKSTRQLRAFCTQRHGALTHKLVPISLQRY